MQATKYTLTITVQALSMDNLPSLVDVAVKRVRDNEIQEGSLAYEDGDWVNWSIEKDEVEF